MTAVNLCYRMEGDSYRDSRHRLISGSFTRKVSLLVEFFKKELDIVKSREEQVGNNVETPLLLYEEKISSNKPVFNVRWRDSTTLLLQRTLH